MLRQYGKKLLWGGIFFAVGYLLNVFLYPVIVAVFSALFGTETIWINLVPAWPAIVFWIVAYTLRQNQPTTRRKYLASLGETKPSAKDTLIYVIRRRALVLDFLAFLTILFVYLLWIIAQTHSLWLCMFYFWIYVPLFAIADILNWYLVYRYWQKDKH